MNNAWQSWKSNSKPKIPGIIINMDNFQKRERLTLESIYNRLKKFHLSHSLFIIGSINAALRFGTLEPSQKDVPLWTLDFLKRRGRTDIERRSLVIGLTRMARSLLLSTSTDFKGQKFDIDSSEVAKAYDAVSDIDYLKGEVGEEQTLADFTLVFKRIGQIQFPLQTDKMTLIGRGFLLFHKLLINSKSPYDFNAKFLSYFDLTLLEFMSTGFVMWTLTEGTLDRAKFIDIDELKGLFTKKSQNIFLELSCGTPQEYKKLVRGEDWKKPHLQKDRYSLDPLAFIPAIKVEKSTYFEHADYVVPQPKFLLDRASSGIFYLLADKEFENVSQANKGKENPFRNAFGEIFSIYVGKHLSVKGQHLFIDFDKELNVGKTKIPDYALLFDDICILFEVKTTLLNAEARCYFEDPQLERAIKSGNICKALEQTSIFKKRILEGEIEDDRFKDIETVISIIVGYEDVYSMNSTLLPMVDQLEGKENLELQFASISDIEVIGTIISQGLNVVELLKSKSFDHKCRQWAIATYLKPDPNLINPILEDSFNEFNKILGLPT